MREVKKCLFCGEEFVTYWSARFCCTPHYILWRKARGWFVTDEFVRHSRGSVSRSKKSKHKVSDRDVFGM